MPIEFQEVLKANVVLAGVVLLGEKSHRDKFAGLVDTEIVLEIMAGGPVLSGSVVEGSANIAETGLVMTLHRDRIQLADSPVKDIHRTSVSVVPRPRTPSPSHLSMPSNPRIRPRSSRLHSDSTSI